MKETTRNHDYTHKEVEEGLHHLVNVGYIKIEGEEVIFTPKFMLKYSVALDIEKQYPRGRNAIQIGKDSFVHTIMDMGEVQNNYSLRELEIMLSLLPVINKHQHRTYQNK